NAPLLNPKPTTQRHRARLVRIQYCNPALIGTAPLCVDFVTHAPVRRLNGATPRPADQLENSSYSSREISYDIFVFDRQWLDPFILKELGYPGIILFEKAIRTRNAVRVEGKQRGR